MLLILSSKLWVLGSNPNGITPSGDGRAELSADNRRLFYAIYFAAKNILSTFAGLMARKGERLLTKLTIL